MPKGYKTQKTLTKEAGREALRQLVLQDMSELAAAQIANAKGIKFLVVREKATGKFLRVGQGRAERLKPEEEIIEVWEKDPSVQAWISLIANAIDKPAEQEQAVAVSGTLKIMWAER